MITMKGESLALRLRARNATFYTFKALFFEAVVFKFFASKRLRNSDRGQDFLNY